MCVQFFRCCCSSSEVNWEKKAVRPTNQIGWKMVKKVYELKIKIWNKRHHRVIWWENLAPADLRSSHFFFGENLIKVRATTTNLTFFFDYFQTGNIFFPKNLNFSNSIQHRFCFASSKNSKNTRTNLKFIGRYFI